MRKMIAFTLCMALLCGCALADTLTGYTQLPTENAYYQLAQDNQTLIRQTFGDEPGFTLLDMRGEPLSKTYRDMVCLQHGLCRVYDGTGYGIICATTGAELVPCKYDYTDAVAADENHGEWNLGITLEDGTENDYDLRDANIRNKYYRFVSSDLYRGTELVTTLTREQYKRGSQIVLHGNYLYLQSRTDAARRFDVYDFSFRQLQTGLLGAAEFEFDGKTVTHVPTGQAAFTEGCALTVGDVSCPYWYISGKIYDVQGNVVGQTEQQYDYDSFSYQDGYFPVMKDSLYGLMDISGREVIPCVSETVLFAPYFETGYEAVFENGQLVFYSQAGEKTETGLDADSVEAENELAAFTDENGNYRIYSAKAGLLPESYSAFTAYGSVIQTSDLEYRNGLMDDQGNTLLNPEEEWSGISLTSDGTALLAYNANGEYFAATIEKE